MKKFIVPTLALLGSLLSAQAQYFTAGNLAVVRVGGSNQNVTSSGGGNTIFIDQYTTNGTLVNSLPLPTNGPNALTLSSANYGGLMSLTPDGTHLVIGGFNAPTPWLSNGVVANVAFSPATLVPRAIATIDGYGNYALPISNTNIFSTYTISGAASDGSNFWALGSGATAPSLGGLVYCGTATVPATIEVATGLFGSGRALNIFGNALYATGYPASATVSTDSGSFMMANLSGALATNSTAFNLPFPTGPEASDTPYDLVINSAGTIAYVADSSSGIVKFTNSGSGWVSNYTILTTNAGWTVATGSKHAISVTADFTQNPPVVYATTDETLTNRLVVFQDTGTNSLVINLATNVLVTGAGGSTNTFRGVRFVPGTPPAITGQPLNVVLSANGTATFTPIILGSAPLSYQWYDNGVAVTGATNSSFSINNVTTFESGGEISVVVSNAFGAVTSSNALLTVNPSYFAPGNLAVVQMGTATQPAGSDGEPVSVIQMTTAGTTVSTFALPSTGPNAFILDNSSTEGFMTLSGNGQYLVLGGYNTNIQTTNSIANFTSTNIHRAVATIDGYGNYALPITNGNIYSTFNLRGAASDGVGNFWVSGSGGTGASIANGELGIIYVGTSNLETNVTVTETGTGNERVLNIYNGNLYLSTGSGSGVYGRGIYMVSNSLSGGISTNTGSLLNNTNIMQTGSTSGPYDFVINPAGTIAYVAEDVLGGIIKFTSTGLPGALWVSNYTIPAITTGAPASGTNCEGLTADFTQNPPVLYVTTAEATANRLVTITDTGASSTATLLATAPAGTIYRGVRMIPGAPPLLTSEPAPFTNDAGGSVTFSVTATGTPTLGYQWYTNGTAVAGATTASLTLNSLTLSQNGLTAYVKVTNNFGLAMSTTALLTVQPPGAPLNVTITTPPQTVNAGSTVTINVSSIGTALTYYWTRNGLPLTDGGSISGSSTASLTISPAYATFDGTYTVLASNSFGMVAANNSTTLNVIDPVILVQPTGSTNLPGVSTNLTVTAAGAPPLAYQWLSNGIAVVGATSSSFSIANAGAISAASYSVIVSNSLNYSITSTPTVVSFTPFLLVDTFSYPNGNLFGDAGSPWTDINGSNPELVINGRVQVAQSNFTTDAQSLYTMPVSNTVVWASFLINLSTLPTNAGGVYFANLEDKNFGFYGRLFILTTNQASLTPGISGTAFPGTYRLGIADNQNDFAGTTATGPAAVVPQDLAPGIDYRVVFFVDLVNDYSAMAVNPAALSDLSAVNPGGVSSGAATDPFTPTNAMAAFGLRQRQGEGIVQLDNLEVSFDYNGAGSGYAALAAGVTASNPVVGLQPLGTTNYTGNPYTMEVAASGIGTAGVGLTYAWYQNSVALTDGSSLTGSATPVLTLSSLVATNSGTYYVIVTGQAGSTQSSNTIISVNTATVAPIFTVEPAASTTISEGGNVTFSSAAVGSGPISYQWYFNNGVVGDGPGGAGETFSGSATSALTIKSSAPGDSGTYTVIATGGTGLTSTSTLAVLVVTSPASVTIGYLRSLLNPTTYQPANTSTLFNVTGVITTTTNQTTGNTASYYLQDNTGGINLFVTSGSDFRPALGDIVTATGVLSTFADNYELDVSEGTAYYVDSILSHNNPLPAPILFPWGNNVAPLSPSISTNIEGSVIVLTNLYFAAYTAPGTNVFTAGTDYIVTNKSGSSYTLFVSDQDTNFVTGHTIPQFAYSVAGPLIQDNTAIGITFTVFTNLVTAAPPAPTILGAGLSGTGGTNFTLQWTAQPYYYTYSILSTTNLSQPFTPLVSGLWFSTPTGTYTDVGRSATARFYLITTP